MLRMFSNTTISTKPDYKFMYSATQGGIYFYVDDWGDETQWWKIHKVRNPDMDDIVRTGDTVMLENVYWPASYLQKYPDDRVYNRYSIDTWTIELVSQP